MSTTPNYGWPLLATNQASPEVTHNEAITDIDQAFGSLFVKALPDSDYTLNISAVPSEASYLTYTFTGTLTADRNVIAPTNRKLYSVWNNTTSPYNIVFKTLSGTGITIPYSATAAYVLLYCDGTNVVSIGTQSVTGPTGATANITPDTHPASASGWDDEFEAGSSVNLSLWAWVNQSSATTAIANGIMTFTSSPGSGGDVWSLLVQSLSGASTPYSFTLKGWWLGDVQLDYEYFGIVLRDSASGKFHEFGCDNNGIAVNDWTNETTYSANPVAEVTWGTYPASILPHAVPIWLRITNDGTNFIFGYSYDGQTFTTLGQVSVTSFITPNQVGIGCGCNIGSPHAMTADIDWFRKTS